VVQLVVLPRHHRQSCHYPPLPQNMVRRQTEYDKRARKAPLLPSLLLFFPW
jgi:hypothetical protein